MPKDEYINIIEKLKLANITILSDSTDGKSQGFYVHKETIKHKNSILVAPNGDDIYELLHHSGESIDQRQNKKIILGAGAQAVVRGAYNVKTGLPVAIKVCPLYEKKSVPSFFSAATADAEIKSWLLSQDINLKIPKTFVKLHGYFVAGDKSSKKNIENKLLYIITDKHEKNLSSILNGDFEFDKIKNILFKVLLMHKKLASIGYAYADTHPGNILLDKDQNPIFCDPESLSLMADCFQGELIFKLLKLISTVFNISAKGSEKSAGIINFIENFVFSDFADKFEERMLEAFNVLSLSLKGLALRNLRPDAKI